MYLKRCLLLLIFLTFIITILGIARRNELILYFPAKPATFVKTVPRRWKNAFESEESGKSENSLYHHTPWNNSNTTGHGYVLVAQYADQMTGASYSILSLQCWAGAISESLKIVEPFLYTGSGFGYTFNSRRGIRHHNQIVKSNNQVKLRDIFDMEKWQNQLVKSAGTDYSYATLEPWEKFIVAAPRNLIIVGRDCIKTELNTCNNKFYKSVMLFAAKQRFRIVRKVQIERKNYSFGDFKHHIFGALDPSEVVVFFRQWGGIVSKAFDRRYAISRIDRCQRDTYQDFLFETSEKVLQDSSKYTSRYLSGNGGKYISVMVRVERFGLKHFRWANSQEEKMAAFNKCQKAIERQVRNMQAIHNTSGLFLAIDTSKHGSRGIRKHTPPKFMDRTLLDVITRQVFDVLRLHGNSFTTVEEWDASFDNISSIRAPGFVAQIQKNLAASGRCLVTAGGGSFQESARLLHMFKHRGRAGRRCVVDVPECL